MTKSNFHIFLNIIRNSFLGEPFDYDNKTYKLKPRIVAPYDLLRKIEKPSSEYEKLLYGLGENFKENARTEMYRKKRGWIAQGITQRKIKKISVSGKTFLVPTLSPLAIGIDTSGVDDSCVIGVCYLDNYDAGIVFLEKHLSSPKAKRPTEYK